MTADIKARVVATDRLVVNFKIFPLSCNGKVTSTNLCYRKLCTHLIARSRPYYRMLLVMHVSDNALFFSKSAIALSHLLGGIRQSAQPIAQIFPADAIS